MYVTDPKLATNEPLCFSKDKGGKAISIMLRTWGEYTYFITELKVKPPKKTFLFSRKTKGKKCLYSYYEVEKHTKQGFRIHWIYSTQKVEEEKRATKIFQQKNLIGCE